MDTNVVFEGLTSAASAPGVIVEAWLAGLFQACVSNALAYEYAEVLQRKLSATRWGQARIALATLLDRSELVPVRYTWRPSSPDPGDEHLIDCAMNGRALVVTSNLKDFRYAETSLGLQTLSPPEMVAYLAYQLEAFDGREQDD